MSTLQEMTKDYQNGVDLLRKAVAGMSEQQVKARPVPGKWSTLEVVCHLADFDPIGADRMKRVIAEDNPQLIGADERRFAAALAYHDRDLEEELGIITATRKQMARILAKLPDTALQRIGQHNELGQVTLEKLLARNVNHLKHHLQFIVEKKKALGIG